MLTLYFIYVYAHIKIVCKYNGKLMNLITYFKLLIE